MSSVYSGSQNSREHISHKSSFSCLRSLETFKIVFVQVQMLQNELFNVFRAWKYEFLRICRGPDRARYPQGSTRAQSPAGPDPRRAPPGPRGGPRRARSLQGPIGARALAWPDPRRAPPGPSGGPRVEPRGGAQNDLLRYGAEKGPLRDGAQKCLVGPSPGL